MKTKCFLLVTFLTVVLSSVNAQTKIPSSDEVLKSAYDQARLENKNVFVIFHASWCGWCHKMDSSMNDISCRKFFSDNYITCHLTVDESKDKKNLENAGAVEFRINYHGENAGLPFWLIFDKNGKLLADSKMRPEGAGPETKGENIGCPASIDEVAYFVHLLKTTSKLSPDQLKIIEERFSKNK